MIGIYKITSPSNKVYIGQSIDIEQRFKQYKYLKCKGQIILYRSLKKHGVEKHKFEILCECEISELNDKERYYQELYSSIGFKGMNCQLVDTINQKRIFSEETKLKMSISAKKKNITLEHRAKTISILIENNKKRLGRHLSFETKEKLRIANLGIKCEKRQGFNHFNSKIVLCKETGVFYGSAKMASIAYNINYGTLKDKLSGRRNIKNNTSLIYV
jgi:group I intron endonuclease